MKHAFNLVHTLAAGLLLFALSSTASTLDPSGDLDTSFGTGGKAQFNLATVTVPSFSRAVIAQAGGKVVVGGGSNNGLFKDYVIQRINSDGTVDSSFGTSGGFTTTDMGFDDQINAMAVNSTGSRFCGGGISNALFGVACYTTNGTLDLTFSSDGKDLAAPPGYSVGRIEGMTFDRDDKLVVVGWSNSTNLKDWIIRRYNTDGSPDTSFGVNSWVIIDWGANNNLDRCFDVAVLQGATHAADKLVVVGSSQNTAGAIVILTSTGALDTTTGLAPTGKFTGTPGALTQFRGVAIEQSTATKYLVVTGQGSSLPGFIVARYAVANGAVNVTGNLANTTNDVGFRIKVGVSATNVERVYASGTTNSGGDFRVVKMKADLTQDTSSPELDYSAITDFGGSDFAQDLVVANSGDTVNERVTAVGGGSGGLTSITVAKYNPNGTPDTSFSGDGKYEANVTGGSTDESRAFGVQSDGKMVVAGTTFNSAGDYDLLVARINTDGTRDTAGWASGTGGWDTRGFATGSAENVSPNGVAIDSNGKAIVVGSTSGTGFTDFFALRYNTNGTLDTTFGGTTGVRNNWGTNSVGTAVAIDASNNVIVGGDITLNGDFTFARLKAADGTLDTSFNGTGKQTVDISAGKSDVLKALAVDPSGRIVAGGECVAASGFFKMCLARLNANGSPDTTFNGTGKVFLNTLSGNDTFDIRSLQLLADGDSAIANAYKIVVGGQYVQSSPSQAMWLVARFNMNGSLDTSFNTTGWKGFTAGPSTNIGSANSVALQYDEKILVFGETSVIDPQNPGFYLNRQITVARLNWDGSVDTTYGTNGFTYATQGSDPGEAYQGFIYPQSNAALKGRAVATNFIIAGDFAFTRYREDPSPIAGASAPDLTAASDSGRSNSDNITKDTTPTFTGTCSQGETVYLLIGGANTQPRTRQICPAGGTYTLTAPALSGIPRTTYSITTRTQSGIGDSAVSAPLSVTIDAEIKPTVVINNPTAGSNQLPNVSVDGTSEAAASVVVTTNHPKGGGCTTGILADGNADGSGTGNWTCSNTAFKQGSHTISVVQTDLAGNVASAVTRSFSVKVSTTTMIASNFNPSKFGQPVTFTATVTPGANADLALTGTTVRFLIDSVQVSAPALDVNGQATYSPTGLGLSVGTHTVQAVYDENANWLASSGSVTPDQLVQKADTMTSATTSANPSVFGQSVTLTAAVAAVSPGAGTPTGTVMFLDGGNPVGSGAVSGGVATFTSSAFGVGSHTFTANFNGDGNFNSSTGSLNGNPQTVNKANTATAVTSSRNPSTLNQSVTFTATISALAPGAGAPSGSVTFFDGASSLGTGTLSAGVATLSTSALSVGNHTITTTYTGDGNFNGSAGLLTGNPQVVKKIPTTTSVTSSQNPSVFGQSVTFTATIAANPPGAGTPTGMVTFMDGASSIGTGTLDGSGMTTLTSSALATGSHTITVSYASDATFDVSTGAMAGNPQVINKSAATTALSSSANPSVFGQPVILTATITATAPGAGTPSGTVTFLDGASTLGTGTLSAGVTTFTMSAFAVGNHTITTTYAGDANFNASAGALTSNPQIVSKADVTTNLTSSQNPALPGQSVTFTATVAATAPGAGTPTGTINFLDGVSTIGSGTLSAGVATFTTTALTPGSHTITSSYAGDANFNQGIGSLIGNPQIVGKAATTTTIDSITPPGPITLGSSVSVSASVATSASGAGTPSGSIVVNDGGAAAGDSCTIALPATSCTLTPSATGNHGVVATYSGDGNFLGSASSASALSVTPPTRTITSSGGPNGSITPATQYIVDGNTASFAVMPNNGYSATMSTTCPEGLGTLSNNTYTTRSISGDCTVTATFVSASTALSLTITDNREFARYGALTNYIVTASNSSGNDVTGLSISGSDTSPSADLDTAGGHWLCFGAAAQCASSGSGPFNDGSVSVPANGSVSWLVSVPVLADAPDMAVTYTVTLTGAGSDIIQSDTNTLTIYRDGFDVGYGDGTQVASPAMPAGWDGNSALTLSPTANKSGTLESLLRAATTDNSGFRIEQFDTGIQTWVRVVANDANGNERATAWARVAANAQLLLSIVGTRNARMLIVVGAEDEIDCAIDPASFWQVQ